MSTLQQKAIELAEGNPGSLDVLNKAYQAFDADTNVGAQGMRLFLEALEDMNIRGSDIYDAFKSRRFAHGDIDFLIDAVNSRSKDLVDFLNNYDRRTRDAVIVISGASNERSGGGVFSVILPVA